MDRIDSGSIEGRTQAVILAAGRGRRMGPATARRPKCLLPVGPGTLLDHQLEMLAAASVAKVWVVSGYRAEQVRRAAAGRAETIHNAHWSRTNSLYSLWLCRDRVRGSLVVLNADVLAHPGVLVRVLATPGSAFAYDSTSGHDDEHMKVELEDGRLRCMDKCIAPERVRGENVGILRFDRPAAARLFVELDSLVAAGRGDLWMAAAVERVARRFPVRGVDVADLPWCEIDFPEDLRAAREKTWPAIGSRSVEGDAA